MPYFCIRFRERRLSFLTCWLTRSDIPFPFLLSGFPACRGSLPEKKKVEKKLPGKFGSYAGKSLPLHPLSEMKRRRLKWFSWGFGRDVFPSLSVLPFAREMTGKRGWEKKIKKTSEKIWRLYLKVLTFASAFGNEAGRQDRSAIFEDIYINNTSSTRARLQHRYEVTLGIRKNRQYL